MKLSVPPAKPLNVLIREQQRSKRGAEATTGVRMEAKPGGEGGSSESDSHGGFHGGEDDTDTQGREMGQEQSEQGAGMQLAQEGNKKIDPTVALSFIRQQQKEDWEALKR